MNQELMQVITRLETRSRQMMFQYEKLLDKLVVTEQKLAQEKERNKTLEEENHRLEEKYAQLKTARMIDMADADDLKLARKRINRMIVQVDRCIANLTI